MKKINIIFIIQLLLLFCGCGKDYLDQKRNANQVVPREVRDYLAIVSRANLLISASDLAFLGADEYYVRNATDLLAGSQFTPFHKNAYIWADDVYENERDIRDWNDAYEKIMYANLALDVQKLNPSPEEYDNWKRTLVAAYFYRAWNYYHLAQTFCAPFDSTTANSELGLPLRLDYDVSLKYDRSTLAEVYEQILDDLNLALQIKLEDDGSIYMPGTTAVQALLSRVYLQMGNYILAMEFANKTLESRSALIDFSVLTGNVSNEYESYFTPYDINNPSIIFYSYRPVGGILGGGYFNARVEYLGLLEDRDLRKKINFFPRSDGSMVYIGSYTGQGIGGGFFTGLTVEETLLIRAECLARMERYAESIADINKLRKYRHGPDYLTIAREDVEDIILFVLEERKRELYMRGRRWEDARRLNREGRYPVAFRRVLDNEEFSLLPASKKWVWPIPENEIANSQIKQNDR